MKKEKEEGERERTPHAIIADGIEEMTSRYLNYLEDLQITVLIKIRRFNDLSQYTTEEKEREEEEAYRKTIEEGNKLEGKGGKFRRPHRFRPRNFPPQLAFGTS